MPATSAATTRTLRRHLCLRFRQVVMPSLVESHDHGNPSPLFHSGEAGGRPAAAHNCDSTERKGTLSSPPTPQQAAPAQPHEALVAGPRVATTGMLFAQLHGGPINSTANLTHATILVFLATASTQHRSTHEHEVDESTARNNIDDAGKAMCKSSCEGDYPGTQCGWTGDPRMKEASLARTESATQIRIRTRTWTRAHLRCDAICFPKRGPGRSGPVGETRRAPSTEPDNECSREGRTPYIG